MKVSQAAREVLGGLRTLTDTHTAGSFSKHPQRALTNACHVFGNRRIDFWLLAPKFLFVRNGTGSFQVSYHR
jgi:hypothetical protein